MIMRSDNGQKEESTEARNKSMLPSPPAKAGQKKKYTSYFQNHLVFGKIPVHIYMDIYMLAQNQSICEFPFCSWLQKKNDRI